MCQAGWKFCLNKCKFTECFLWKYRHENRICHSCNICLFMSLMMVWINYTCHEEFTHLSGYTHIQCWSALCGIGLCGIDISYRSMITACYTCGVISKCNTWIKLYVSPLEQIISVVVTLVNPYKCSLMFSNISVVWIYCQLSVRKHVRLNLDHF